MKDNSDNDMALDDVPRSVPKDDNGSGSSPRPDRFPVLVKYSQTPDEAGAAPVDDARKFARTYDTIVHQISSTTKIEAFGRFVTDARNIGDHIADVLVHWHMGDDKPEGKTLLFATGRFSVTDGVFQKALELMKMRGTRDYIYVHIWEKPNIVSVTREELMQMLGSQQVAKLGGQQEKR